MEEDEVTETPSYHGNNMGMETTALQCACQLLIFHRIVKVSTGEIFFNLFQKHHRQHPSSLSFQHSFNPYCLSLPSIKSAIVKSSSLNIHSLSTVEGCISPEDHSLSCRPPQEQLPSEIHYVSNRLSKSSRGLKIRSHSNCFTFSASAQIDTAVTSFIHPLAIEH